MPGTGAGLSATPGRAAPAAASGGRGPDDAPAAAPCLPGPAMGTGRGAAAFLDRDGTLIVERHYLADPAGVEVLPRAVAGLRALRALGYRLVVVTNQSGIGRGLFTAAALEAVHARLRALLAAAGVTLDGIYACPHLPSDDCACRKPRTGLAERACAELGLDPRGSVMIGDKASDIEMGRRCGMATILVHTGYGGSEVCSPDAAVPDLAAAAAWLAARASALRAGGPPVASR